METSAQVPVASAIWAVEQVAAELRETYLGVAAAMVLLQRVGAGCPHPALRLARRSGEDAHPGGAAAVGVGARRLPPDESGPEQVVAPVTDPCWIIHLPTR
ncbi:hypothetical protein ABZ428_31095, partial [Micromonospora matsumotoense]